MSAVPGSKPKSPPDFIYRASMTLPDGTKIFARQYGKKAFKIPVSPDNDDKRPLKA